MHEGDLLDWLSVVAVLAAAVGAALHAVHVVRHRGRFVLLAAILGFLAVDDGVGLHERVTSVTANGLGVTAGGDVLFLLPYLPLLLVAFVLLWSAARESHAPAGRTLSFGLVLLVGALALRAMAGLVSLANVPLAGWQRTLGAAALHDTELLAWCVVAVGLALLVRAQMKVPPASTP